MRKLTTEEFISKAKLINGDKYDYSLSNYNGSKTKIKIICPIHGEFEQLPNNHLNGSGCYLCGVIKTHEHLSSNNENFIQKANIIHNNKYDYSKIEYVNNKSPLCVVCHKHGEFYVRPDNHLKGSGCPICYGTHLFTTDEFIQKAKEIHGDKYDYSKVDYINSQTKVCIVCFKHGEFWQIPNAHINQKQGCPICKESIIEKEIVQLFYENNIKYERQKRFDWLGKQSLDFYLPDYNIGIECQGEQHFKPIKYFGGDKRFKYAKKLDRKKFNLCKNNGINLLYYTNIENIEENNYIIYNKENLFNNKQILIEAINNVKIY